jgi:hypothetical protein
MLQITVSEKIKANIRLDILPPKKCGAQGSIENVMG